MKKLPRAYKEALKKNDTGVYASLIENLESENYKQEDLENFLSRNIPDSTKETMGKMTLMANRMGHEIFKYETHTIWMDDVTWGMEALDEAPNTFRMKFHVNVTPSDAARIATKVAKIALDMNMTIRPGIDYTIKETMDDIEIIYCCEAYSVLDRTPLHIDFPDNR